MSIIERDLTHIWHPCMQMKDFEQCPPVIVNRAQGSLLDTNHGQLIDSQSSWWCKSLGHQHPKVKEAIEKQLSKFEHIISANCTHECLAKFGQIIESITGLQHVFFASDGSCAVEIALKLAIQKEHLERTKPRKKIINLANAYHGETLATLAVSNVGLYKTAFNHLNFPTYTINNLAYVSNQSDCLNKSCDDLWESVLPKLEAIASDCLAILVEPLLQGAGGMLIYSVDFLKKLCRWAQKHNVLIIADEIMTGIGRTGSWLAFDYLDIKPDLICLSKGLTSGTIPMSCVAIDHAIYECFYDDYQSGKSFLHSHTYSGNALGIAAAIATIESIKNENVFQQVQQLGENMFTAMRQIAERTGCLTNIRQFGAMVAADIDLPSVDRAGFQVFQKALSRGALMRPLGNTIYWLPPLNTPTYIIEQLAEITEKSIVDVWNQSKLY